MSRYMITSLYNSLSIDDADRILKPALEHTVFKYEIVPAYNTPHRSGSPYKMYTRARGVVVTIMVEADSEAEAKRLFSLHIDGISAVLSGG